MKFIAFILLAIGLFFIYLAVNSSLLPYNDQGRYFDQEEGIIYHSQRIITYNLAAAFFLILSTATFLLTKASFFIFTDKPPNHSC